MDASAQSGFKNWYSGWCITLHDDTIKGYVYLDNLVSNQYICKYSTDQFGGNNRSDFKPGEIKSYLSRDVVYESLTAMVADTSGHIFIRRLQNGILNLYCVYDVAAFTDGMNMQSVSGDERTLQRFYMLKRGNDFSVWIEQLKPFNQSMSYVVQDDQILSKKILNKEKGYKQTNIEQIVQEYNKYLSDK